MHDTISYWVGFPADDVLGVVDCGQLLAHPESGIPPLINHRQDAVPVRDIVYTISDLERRFGQFVTMVPQPLWVKGETHHNGVVGFITDRGYRVALVPTQYLDVTVMQEAVGEWVEGV